MRKIGFDKRDSQYRKFYFDDDIMLSSNPPKYKVWYVDDENEIDYIECQNVFYLKPAPVQPQSNKKDESTTVVNVDSISNISKSTKEDNVIKIDNQENTNTSIIEQPKKKRTYKKKTQTELSSSETCETCEIRKFEYKIIDEPFISDSDIQDTLNSYGQGGWELCGFEIYKTGIVKSSNNIICILKRKI